MERKDIYEGLLAFVVRGLADGNIKGVVVINHDEEPHIEGLLDKILRTTGWKLGEREIEVTTKAEELPLLSALTDNGGHG